MRMEEGMCPLFKGSIIMRMEEGMCPLFKGSVKMIMRRREGDMLQCKEVHF